MNLTDKLNEIAKQHDELLAERQELLKKAEAMSADLLRLQGAHAAVQSLIKPEQAPEVIEPEVLPPA